jgi:DNA sulfur modification protein DndB
MALNPNQTAPIGAGVLPYDPAEGTPLVVLEVDGTTCTAIMPVGQLLQVVPDPIASEKPDRVAEDARLRQYGELRAEVQRLVEGAKARNAKAYARYLVEGYARDERPAATPPITLYHRERLHVVDLAPGVRAAIVPHGDYFAAIDGETQRIGWGLAADEEPRLLQRRVPVLIHHGKDEKEARQAFYDLNTREVKPNAAVAIAMDSQDPATAITRTVAEQVDVIRGRVNLRRRQLRKKDEDVLTISALRTGVVTTMLGEAGLQVGSRPVELPEGTEPEQLEHAVLEVWTPILELLEEELDPERRPEVVVSSPSVLAGIGVLAHQAIPSPPRRGDTTLTVDEVVERLEGVMWERQYEDKNGEPASPWDGIAGKFTPSGRFSIGGPKEVGHAVAKALRDPLSQEGRQIRGS